MASKKEKIDDVVIRDVRVRSDSHGFGYVACIVVLGWVIYKSGYRSGIDVSNRVLKRHDKDIRRMKKESRKREKQLRKELTPGKEKKGWWPYVTKKKAVRNGKEQSEGP